MYQHILVAVELSKSARDTDLSILAAARTLQNNFNAKLTVIHISEGHVTGYGHGTASHHIANDMELKQALFPPFKTLLDDAGLADAELQLGFGRAADEIHLFSSDHNCDLIVIGSHGYSGVKALLGSTANAVVHGASCDVFTVRIS